MKSRLVDGEYEVTYKINELVIPLPEDISTDNITIRVYSDIRGVEKDENSGEFSVYPNPSLENFMLENPQVANTDWIKIFNSDSREMLKLNSIGNRDRVQNIDLSSLPNGVYYLHISSKGILTRKRIIIEK